ncbi:MAG: hypothetical protein ACKVWV_09730 [Planctomycetota bacterium]
MSAVDVRFPASVRVVLALTGSLVASCHTVFELDEFDRMLRTTEAQTIVVAGDHTLYAPFALAGARGYAELVVEEMRAVGDLFGTTLDTPLSIWLRPVRGVRPRIEIEGQHVRMIPAGEHPRRGVEAYANGTAVVLYVEEEARGTNAGGQPITGQYDPDGYRNTLRHELAHVWTHRTGIAHTSWFNEGLAEYVESMQLEDGRLVQTDASPLLGHAARLPRERCAIRRLLDWREDGMRIHAGLEEADLAARVASGAFVHFMLARVEGDSFLARARTLRSLPRDDLLAHEESWQAWRTSRE